MTTIALRRLPAALAICAIVAGIAVYAVTASWAGASASFDPALAAAPATAKFAITSSAPYTEAAAAKRTAEVPTRKFGKSLATAPGAAPVAAPTTTSGSGELGQATSILAAKIRQYPILAGATVEFGDARGYQAISYYRSGRIVISRTHTASLDRIINHEIWHIIDWRDNGRIDWGENIPPK